jgi:CRISPR/Cas system CMR subunit Cmr4 (Cas7 group RAMP superfamily)
MTSMLRTIWRVTVESTSCFTIGTGGGDDLRDSICVTDANGLPALPATSIAGVLRSLIRRRSVELENEIFGYLGRDGGRTSSDGQASRLEVSWGHVHDSKDRVVPMRAPLARRDTDAVLEFLRVGVTRDHVSIGPNGVVAGRKKFDETLVPVGARFTFELQLRGEATSPEAEARHAAREEAILTALRSDGVRFGGRTRMGHGRFRVQALAGRRFVLRAGHPDVKAWLAHPVRVDAPAALPALDCKRTHVDHLTVLDVELAPEDYWLVGGGEPHPRFALSRGSEQKTPDTVPLTQKRIQWGKGGATVDDERVEALIPGTSIKGALRHRFVYLARCAGLGASDFPWRELDTALFGTIKGGAASTDDDGNRAATEENDGLPGCVFIDDVCLPLEPDDRTGDGALDHVCLDRFSGAPVNGMLFNEAPRYKTDKGKQPLRFSIVVDRAPSLPAKALHLLKEALDDLVNGRLALGAGSNRGHGYFRGKITTKSGRPLEDA